MSAAYQRRLFTVSEYYAMAEFGILAPDERVELLEGQIIADFPIGSRHAACVNRLHFYLACRINRRAQIHIRNPVRLSRYSEPEPDVALLKPRDDFYAEAHPRPEDVLLIIEVADTSEEADRRLKVPLYARSGIPEVWLVALNKETVEVYRSPSPDGYAETSRLARGESLHVQALPDVVLTVDELLG
ncbi:MAG TPA: Uma2 family endonuclease [Rhodothermales bacterium]|nr:Uma2 family endonuclease [Rhodothermales bacterium]